MTDETTNDDVTRRTILKTTGAAGTIGMTGAAGCLSAITGDGGDSGTLNVLHGWTGGDGKTAAEALFSGFEDEHGDVETDIEPGLRVAGGDALFPVFSNLVGNAVEDSDLGGAAFVVELPLVAEDDGGSDR